MLSQYLLPEDLYPWLNLVSGALVVVVGLCTGLVAYYSGALSKRSAGALPDFAYVPADASTVAYVDCHRIMSSEFRQRLRQVLPTGEEKNRRAQQTGIDLERDIDGVETEDWIYGHPPAKTVFVKFTGEKVTSVKQYPT